MNTTVVSETELEAQDQDQDDVLFYTLQEVTLVSAPSSVLWARHPPPCRASSGLSLLPPQGASSFFSLVGANRPALRLDQSLDLERWPNMTFRLLARVSRPLPLTALRAASAPSTRA